jgi:hypothetical protein
MHLTNAAFFSGGMQKRSTSQGFVSFFWFFRMICGRAVTEGLQVACHDVRASGWS